MMNYSPRQLWYWWRSLRLPWRRKWLVGTDLTGNTFWEFRDDLRAGRYRRIVKSRWRTHHADVQLAPQWIQWLRHTRPGPPTIQEQRSDQTRQLQLKQLAAEADRRWAEKPSFLDAPGKQQPNLGHQTNDPGAYVGQTEPEQKQGVSSLSASPKELRENAQGNDNRKGRFRGNINDTIHGHGRSFGSEKEAQPGAWAPQASQRRE